MTISESNRFWTLITILLAMVIITGGLVIWFRHDNRPVAIAITNPPVQEPSDYVYIGGAVTSPGIYPIRDGDNLKTLIRVAGGTTNVADTSLCKLLVPAAGEEKQPQKVDINRAETWLLEALPGIGKIRAQAIIDYRRQNDQFRHTSELTNVEGISLTIYQKIKDLITVVD